MSDDQADVDADAADDTTNRIIGIGGGTAAGKSTIASNLADELDGLHISTDSFFKGIDTYETDDQTEINFDSPEAIDWGELTLALQDLKHGRTTSIPVYDFETAKRGSTVDVEPSDPIIVEGTLALHNDSITSLIDDSIYVHLEADQRLARRVKRDTEERGETVDDVVTKYQEHVRPMHNRYVQPTMDEADYVVRGDVDSNDLYIRSQLGYLDVLDWEQ